MGKTQYRGIDTPESEEERGGSMKMKKITGYKFIQKNMHSKKGSHLWEIGKWHKHKGKIELCNRGFHACRTARQSLEYIYGDRWFLVEARGKIKEEENKFVASEMCLIRELPLKKIMVKWAVFCAKQCLEIFEKKYPEDKRPREAIEAAEKYSDGKITLDELNEKAGAARAASDAARAAREAAWEIGR